MYYIFNMCIIYIIHIYLCVCIYIFDIIYQTYIVQGSFSLYHKIYLNFQLKCLWKLEFLFCLLLHTLYVL